MTKSNDFDYQNDIFVRLNSGQEFVNSLLDQRKIAAITRPRAPRNLLKTVAKRNSVKCATSPKTKENKVKQNREEESRGEETRNGGISATKENYNETKTPTLRLKY